MIHYFDAGNVYRAAREAAQFAVTARRAFRLIDVAPEDEWGSIVATGSGVLAVTGSLRGVIDALRTRGATAADVLSQVDNAADPHLPPIFVAIARGWIANAIGLGLDEETTRRHVSAELASRGWLMHTGAIAQLVLSARHCWVSRRREDHGPALIN